MIPAELTALEVLGIAIRSEMDAQAIYREMAARVSNPRAKERFSLLAAEELQHQRILERKYAEMFPDVPLKLPPSQLPPSVRTTELRHDLSLCEALQLAIQEERRSRDFYLEAVPAVSDLSGKTMLKFMADMEYAHQMALTAEYDLLVKYPHYYEDVEEPWQEEIGLRKQQLTSR